MDALIRVSDVIEGLQLRSSLILNGYTIRRTRSYYRVTTPHGMRNAYTLEQVLILLRGEWFCTKCNRVLPHSRFTAEKQRGKERLGCTCKQCDALQDSVWYQQIKHTERYRAHRREYARVWRSRNKERVNAQKRLRKIRRRMDVFRLTYG
jgi:hypothetical protein